MRLRKPLSPAALAFVSCALPFAPIAALSVAGCGGDAPPPATPASSERQPPLEDAAATPAPKAPQSSLAYPKWPTGDVSDTFHGVKVADPYRSLEPWNDAVRAWSAAQTAVARASIDAYPGITQLRARIAELKKAGGPRFGEWAQRKGVLFAMSFVPPKQQATLVTLGAPNDPASAHVVVDPNVIDPSGKTTIDFYVPSPDGKRVAVSLSKAGTEAGDVHVYEVATGKELPDVLPRVYGGTAGGSVAWNAAGTGFFYTRYPHEGERPAADLDFYQQLYFHEIGKKDSADKYVIGKELPKIAEIEVVTRDDGKYTAMRVANGDGGEVEYFLHASSAPLGAWTQLSTFDDKVVRLAFGAGDDVFLLSRKDAPRGKVLRVSATKPELAKALTIVPEADGAMSDLTVTPKHLYVREVVGGPSRVRAFDLTLKGAAVAPIPLPPIARVDELFHGAGEDVLIHVQTHLEPPAWYRYAGAGALTKTAFATTTAAKYDDAEVVRETCTSKDGTKIPMSLIQKKGAPRDGNTPVLLTGYGGYDLSLEPTFTEDYRPLLDAGVVMAIANLRGGGEYGEAWHEAGKLTRKQNVFDDFAACAQHLITTKVTRKEKLAITGRSNGGLLMGAMITQHPELFRAVVAGVGLFDALRAETDPNGEFIATEVGTTKVPEQFAALYAYSPYHHVAARTDYPAILFTTGANDPRVAPWHSRKMAAALQATGTTAPVLLHTKLSSGHGMGRGLDERIEDLVDTYAFVFQQLGVTKPE